MRMIVPGDEGEGGERESRAKLGNLEKGGNCCCGVRGRTQSFDANMTYPKHGLESSEQASGENGEKTC